MHRTDQLSRACLIVCTAASDCSQRARTGSIGTGQPSTRPSSQRRCMLCRRGSLDGVLVFCRLCLCASTQCAAAAHAHVSCEPRTYRVHCGEANRVVVSGGSTCHIAHASRVCAPEYCTGRKFKQLNLSAGLRLFAAPRRAVRAYTRRSSGKAHAGVVPSSRRLRDNDDAVWYQDRGCVALGWHRVRGRPWRSDEQVALTQEQGAVHGACDRASLQTCTRIAIVMHPVCAAIHVCTEHLRPALLCSSLCCTTVTTWWQTRPASLSTCATRTSRKWQSSTHLTPERAQLGAVVYWLWSCSCRSLRKLCISSRPYVRCSVHAWKQKNRNTMRICTASTRDRLQGGDCAGGAEDAGGGPVLRYTIRVLATRRQLRGRGSCGVVAGACAHAPCHHAPGSSWHAQITARPGARWRPVCELRASDEHHHEGFV